MPPRKQKGNYSDNSSFLFGDNPASFAGFCETAARRIAFFLPIAITFSSSVTIVLTYIMGLLWLFGGRWKERFHVISSSGILLAAIPLILWTGIGIIRYEDSLFGSFRYWLGHYPYLFILVLATLLIQKKNQYAILSSINLAIVLCCLWGIGFASYYSDLNQYDFTLKRIRSIYLYRNTICFGVALALWGGIWACLPYSSRYVPWLRKRMPRFLINGMVQASRTSLLDLILAFVPNVPSVLRRYPLALLLALLRWGIVVGVFFFLFVVNPSRTAQLAVLLGYGTLLLAWNRKKGILVALCVLFPFAALLGHYSKTFETKSEMTFADLRSIVKVMRGKESLETFIKHNRDRIGIQASLIPDIRNRPLCGHGMEKAAKIVKSRTPFIDPHCEFVYMQLQHGMIGLSCFLLWILSLFVAPLYRSSSIWKPFGLFLAVLIVVDCFFNNALSYHCETYLLCLSVALVAIQPKRKRFPSNSQTMIS